MAFIDGTSCEDKLEIYRINKDGSWKLEVETNNHPSLWCKFLKFLGLKNYAGDALTNYAINDLAVHTGNKYTYASVGIDGSSSSNFDLNDLVSPVMTRTSAVIGYTSTYSTNATYPDTVVYTIVMTATGDYTLQEAGLHTAATSGYMGSRQTFSNWSVTNGESFALVWKIVYGRG